GGQSPRTLREEGRSGGIPEPTVKVRMGGARVSQLLAARPRSSRSPDTRTEADGMSDTIAYEAPMRRAFELAARGPVTGGNPRVGAVLLDAEGRIVAEGWHRGAGTPHAEVD